ncbi:MAG: dihydrolipoamide acetyltransferase family protein [Actinomycetota bacterium]|jgi:2-oxoisovalerate dehydrogenase E2 component (dihydrolipoyl transacylase)|nr:dihydrolipoamide acetyltransferase family protein [Actinomycetota bacterium]
MGTFELRLPDIGEGIAEAELVTWLVGVGDHVRVDDPVAEVMTDKATVDLPSPVDGTVAWLAVEEGIRIAVGAPVMRFDIEGAGNAPAEPAAPDVSALHGMVDDTTASTHPPSPLPDHTDAVPAPGGFPAHLTPGAQPPTPPAAASDRAPALKSRPPLLVTAPSSRPLAAPAVRRRAAEAGVDLRMVRGSGPAGRIEHSDLDRFHDRTTSSVPTGPAIPTMHASTTDVAVTGVRRVIAENMTEAARRIPHITYVEEVDVTELERLRQHMNDRRADGSPKLTPLAFIVRALVAAVADHPDVNARFDDDEMVVHRFGAVHVGIATQTPKGLIVPVLRHAEARDVWDCAAEIHRLSIAARGRSVERSDLSGSTITITSLGALGGVITTPIINRPEVTIVGINKMQVRPVWDGSGFTPRTMMNLSSSFDHRIIDGWDAAVFIGRIKELVEQPALMFMGRR